LATGEREREKCVEITKSTVLLQHLSKEDDEKIPTRNKTEIF